jgi:hypothetical protein
MPRGSKRGERRGGRQRGTPNKRTVLTDKILAAASASPKAAPHDLLSILMDGQTLPADTRMAVAAKVVPATTSRSKNNRAGKSVTNTSGSRSKKGPASLAPLYFLLGVAQDTGASPEERRRAASQAAQYFLPKNPKGKKTFRRRKFPADEYGFAIDPQLAKELRDIKLKLACLPLSSTSRSPYAIAQKSSKLQARIKEIKDSLQCPCPSEYRLKHYIDRAEVGAEIVRDSDRLKILQKRRLDKKILTQEENLEEAIRGARYDSFMEGPEMAARERLSKLRERRRPGAPALTLAEETTFRFLSLLYPLPPRVRLQDMPEEAREAILEDHPFLEPRYTVGNLNYTDRFLILGTSKRRQFT